MSRMIQIQVDSSLNQKLKLLNEELSKSGEEIVSQDTLQVDGKTIMVISVKETKKSKKNLLLDQIDAGQMKDPFDGKRILND